mgnify:CR=1 FL=1
MPERKYNPYQTDKRIMMRCPVAVVLLAAIRLLGQDPGIFSDPRELQVAVYPGNNGFSVLQVSEKNHENDTGYEYVGISTSGKPSKNRWVTRLMVDLSESGERKLNFVMTISGRAVKESDKFVLQLDRPLLSSPAELLPVEVEHRQSGVLVFQTKNGNKMLKMDMGKNTAVFSWIPGKEFEVRWNKDGFELRPKSEKVETWRWDTAWKIGFRGIHGGVTAVYLEEGVFPSLFSERELFYLK